MQLGEIISGKYRLLRLLGDGGMGAVYEAHHEVLGAKVAIKVLHEDLARKPELVDRFLREARVLAQIANPHVVRVLDVAMGDATHQAYIVMELLGGEPLSALLGREHKLPLATAVGYATQVLDALSAAHPLGVVHRDLKPENIFVTREGDRTVLKVIDFGIAKAGVLAGVSPNLTVAGALMGTPEYMAPEQAHSADRADARSDIYAVGVLLYEMISGHRPVDGEDPRVVAAKIERGEVHPLIHRSPEVPRELAGLVHRAMAPRPEMRFNSAAEMRSALEAAVGPRPSLIPPSVIGAPMSAVPGSFVGPGAVTNLTSGAARVEGGRPSGTMYGSETQAPRTDPAPTPAYAVAQGGPSLAALQQRASYVPPDAAYAVAPSPARGVSRRRGSGGTMWLLAGLALLIGGGIAAALMLSRSSTPVATKTNATTAPTESAAAPEASTAPPPEAVLDPSLPPLPVGPAATVARTIVAPRGSGAPVPNGSSSGPIPGGALPSGPFGVPPFTFPTGLPSGFPNPFPLPATSGVGPVLTIPTSLPGFGFPPDPAAPPAPGPSTSPHRGNR